MNLFTGEASQAYFGGEVPFAVRALLARAAAVPRSELAALLWTAQALCPSALPIYYLLYKHHAACREFEQAEAAARRGLLEAAAQAGLDPDWRQVSPHTLPPGLDFQQPGPARFWLFTLKALAFIALRQQQAAQAAALLRHISGLDTMGARIGDEVIARLADSTR